MTCRETHNDLKVVVKVGSYFALPDGGLKRYCHRQTLPSFTVDHHHFSLLELVNHIAATLEWGLKQYITLWRSIDDACIQIESDQQLLEWFVLNLKHGVVHIDAQIHDFNGPLHFSPTKCRLHPKVRSKVSEASQPPPSNVNPQHEPCNPTKESAKKLECQKAKSEFS